MIFNKDSSDIFSGIFTYLRQNNSDEVFKRLVQTDASSVHYLHGGPNVVFDPLVVGNEHIDNWASEDIENSNIMVSLFDHFVSLSEYSIRSRNNDNSHFPLEWIVEGTNDFIHWTTLHYHERNDDINGLGASSSYQSSNDNYFCIFRFTMIGRDSSNSNSYFILNKIEFFGSLIHKQYLCPHTLFHNYNSHFSHQMFIFLTFFMCLYSYTN